MYIAHKVVILHEEKKTGMKYKYYKYYIYITLVTIMLTQDKVQLFWENKF